jgi:hypothetical protein
MRQTLTAQAAGFACNDLDIVTDYGHPNR